MLAFVRCTKSQYCFPAATYIILYSFPILPPPPNASSSNYNYNNDSANSNNNAAQKRLQQTQAKVDEVVGIMRVNVEKVLERDQKLSELGERADQLEQGASQFEQQACKLKRKQWWANMKMMIILGVIAVVLLIIIIGKTYRSEVIKALVLMLQSSAN